MEFKSFKEETPDQFSSLLIKQENGNIVRGYYVLWSNTVYLAIGSKKSQAIYWKYYENN